MPHRRPVPPGARRTRRSRGHRGPRGRTRCRPGRRRGPRRARRPGHRLGLGARRQGRLRDGAGAPPARSGTRVPRHAERGLLPADRHARACATASSSSPTARPSPTARTATPPTRCSCCRPNSLTYRLVNTAKSGAWRITKTFVTDPARSTVLEDVRFESLTGKEYQLYLLHDVALSMTGNDDTGRTGTGGALLSSDGTQRQRRRHQPGARQDLERLPRHLRRLDRPRYRPRHGLVLRRDHARQRRADRPGQGERPARTTSSSRSSIGFGGDREPPRCRPRRRRSAAGFAAARTAYDEGWAGYLGSLEPVPPSASRLDDRVERLGDGARGAARTRPCAAASSRHPAGPGPGRTRCSTWRSTTPSGPATSTRSPPGCSRSATTPRRTARWTSCGPCSSAPTARSRRTRGSTARRCSATCRWTRWRSRSCWRTSSAAPAPPTGTHVKKSADYVVAHGPRTPQERWENAAGYSPATIAAEIAGLVCAADIATTNGDDARAADTYLAEGRRVAAAASSRWTATTPARTARRRTTCGSPRTATRTSGTKMQVSDGGPLIDERQGRRPQLPRAGPARRASGPTTR